MTSKFRDLIEAAFSRYELEEALVSKISDHIDYDDIADMVLDNLSDEISEAAAEIAQDYLT